ncbi:MAG: helix-turn-helix transcriptional regulator [Alphaproteobacteria bacterium GM7ARS4]|nr:helix-turn-helix transcriptional regulator [Alphaproteobacteria bacterium GM7ARS4]
MMTHQEVWQAIDDLAKALNLSPSALAKKAGLDPTIFNKSKRINAEGRPRWPNTESIVQILRATGCNWHDLTGSSTLPHASNRSIPLIGMAKAGMEGYFDDAGYPIGYGLEEIEFPDFKDPNAYALEINGDSMAPVYRHGDIILVSPNSDIRAGDRIVLKNAQGEIMAKELRRQTERHVSLRSLNPAYENIDILKKDVLWTARIIWASQ